MVFFFFKQKTAYEMRISDWSSDVCSSDLKALQLIEKVDPKAYQATTSDPGRAAVLKAVKAQILLDMGERRQGESLLREALVEMRSDGVSNDEMAPFRKRLAGVAAPD